MCSIKNPLKEIFAPILKPDFFQSQSCIFVSGPCQVGNTSSYSNTEVKQHWAWIVLGWETAWELQVLLTKKQSRVPLPEHVSQADCSQTLSSRTGSGKVWTCSRQLDGDCCKVVPQSTGHLNVAQCRKAWLQIKEDLGWKITGSKLGANSLLWNLR